MDFEKERQQMVKEQIASRGITDRKVLEAFIKVPRHKFVPKKFEKLAYSDHPLSIGYDATISQPYIVALMCQLLNLDKGCKVLDIGTGSGYQAAILSEICHEVISVERVEELATTARSRLVELRYNNVKVIHGDGSRGYREGAPYDGIVVAATTDEITKEWKEQLKEGGIVVCPQLEDGSEKLVRVKKTKDGFVQETHGYVRFVPLIKG